MPTRAPHMCSTPGCRNMSVNAYCVDCQKNGHSMQRTTESTRQQAHKRGYDHKWRKYRASFLKLHPWCEDPDRRHEGEQRMATQVDHIIPHKGNLRLFWDTHNHQSLCASCGGYKSAVEPGGRAHSEQQQLPPVSGVVGVY